MILSTHVGSLPRPAALVDLLSLRHAGELQDNAALERALERAVDAVVRRQVEVGIDIVNDGEQGKVGYATYVTERLSGFGGPLRAGHIVQDLAEHKALARRLVDAKTLIPDTNGASCIGPVAAASDLALRESLRHMERARARHRPAGAFMSAASPGVVSVFQRNEHYPSESHYLEAVAEAMRPEYEAIVEAGYTLQIDCPDLAMNRHLEFADQPLAAFLRRAAQCVEALNHATRHIAPEAMRMHLCWGNYPGPHHRDVPLEAVLALVYQARPATICVEGANARHAHEWAVFRQLPLPDEKRLAPGLLDSCSNCVEHPEWIAQRLETYAQMVGVERLDAGSDCGFSSFAGYPTVDDEIVWLKLRALVEGTALANQRLGLAAR